MHNPFVQHYECVWASANTADRHNCPNKHHEAGIFCSFDAMGISPYSDRGRARLDREAAKYELLALADHPRSLESRWEHAILAVRHLMYARWTEAAQRLAWKFLGDVGLPDRYRTKLIAILTEQSRASR